VIATLNRELTSPRTYGRIAYLLLAGALGTLEFVFLVTSISLGAGLAITLVGIPILVSSVYAWGWLAELERGLIGALTGRPIANPYRPLPAGGWWARLRARLADPAPPAVAHPPGPPPADVPAVRFAADERPREERFAAALARERARMVHVEDLPDVLRELEVRTAVVTDDRVPLPDGIERLPADRAPDADAGVTVAVAACATTGTVIAAASEREPRAVSVFPRVHVVGVPRDALLDTPGDFLRGLRAPPSAFSMITGPARSADIEGEVVLGLQGPLAVVVVLI
jgi:L-lactate utilization protein LutC